MAGGTADVFFRRVRKHYTVDYAIFAVFLSGLLGHGALKLLRPGVSPPAWVIDVPLALLVPLVLYRFWSAWTVLRCPACGASAWAQVSRAASIVGMMGGAQASCARCTTCLMDERCLAYLRRLRFAWIGLGAGVILAVMLDRLADR